MIFNSHSKVVGPHCTLKGITDEIKIVYLDGRPDIILESRSYLLVDRLIETPKLEG
jgi:hypothetical protein